MDSLFEIWFSVFPGQPHEQHHQKQQIAYYPLKYFLILAQNIQFFWYTELKISNWNSYESFWNALSMASLDVSAAKYKFLPEFSIAAASLILFMVCGLLLIRLSMILGKKCPSSLFFVLRLALFSICEIGFIPFNIIMLLTIKYSNGGYEFIAEYSDKIDASTLEVGSIARPFYLIALLSFLLITILYEISSFEIRSTNDKNLNEKKIHSFTDLLWKLSEFATCYLYVNFGKNHFNLYLLIISTSNFVVCMSYVYFIPYYCKFLNGIKVFVTLDCALISLFFWIGSIMDDASITFTLFLPFQLILFFLVYSILDFRYSKIPSGKLSISQSFYSYERSIRPKLHSGKSKINLIKKLNKNSKFHSSKLNKVIQSYYCNDILDNCTLALNKVFQSSHTGFDIITNYQVFKCKKILTSICGTSSESFKLYRYFLEFSKIKSVDEEFCEVYMRLFEKMNESRSKLSDLKNLIVESAQKLNYLEVQYRALLLRFPYSNEIKQNYGSFLLNILGDFESGNRLMSRVDGTRILNKSSTKNALKFIGDRCFLVVSGDKQSLGRVLFFNQSILNFLGYSGEVLKTLTLNELVPKEFTKHHDSYLIRFIEECLTNIVFKNSPLCLVDSEGYLCECTANIECVGFEKSVNFICAIDPLSFRKREVAIISEHGFIFSHSKGFPSAIGRNSRLLEGRFIQECLSQLDFDNLQPNEEQRVWVSDLGGLIEIHKVVSVILKNTRIRNSVLHLLYISEDETEISTWSSNAQFYDLSENNLNDKRLDTVLIEGFEEFKENIHKKKVKIVDNKQLSINELSEKAEIFNNSKKSDSYQPSNITNKDIKILRRTNRGFKIMKVLIFLSILGVIISNIILLVYLQSEIDRTTSLKSASNLGEFVFLMTKLALMLRNTQINIALNDTSYIDLNEISNVISNLTKVQDLIFNSYDSWSYCKASSIAKHNEIPYWVLESKPKVKQGNLNSFIDLLLANSKDTLLSYQSNINPNETSIFFVLANSYSLSYNKIFKSLLDLTECEKSRTLNLISLSSVIFIVCGTVFGVLFFLIALCLLSIDIPLNQLWDHLRKRFNSAFYDTRRKITERLATYHEKSEFLELENDHTGHFQKFSTVKYRHSLRYLIVVSLLFLAVILLSIINHFVFEKNMLKFLYYKPELTLNFMESKIKRFEICFFATEGSIRYNNISLSSIYKGFEFSQPFINEVTESINYLKKNTNLITNDEAKNLLSAETKEIMYHRIINEDAFLSHGTISGNNFLMQEANYISSETLNHGIEEINDYYSKIVKLNFFASQLDNYLKEDSTKSINLQARNFFLFSGIYCFLLLLAYLFIFIPYLNKEIKILRNITKIMSILPMNGYENKVAVKSRSRYTKLERKP